MLGRSRPVKPIDAETRAVIRKLIDATNSDQLQWTSRGKTGHYEQRSTGWAVTNHVENTTYEFRAQGKGDGKKITLKEKRWYTPGNWTDKWTVLFLSIGKTQILDSLDGGKRSEAKLLMNELHQAVGAQLQRQKDSARSQRMAEGVRELG